MREIRSLLWKEWHETRLFLWIAWGLFIGLPIIGGFEAEATSAHRFEFLASPWIIFCGPLLAIVVGVAATCRDLQTKLEDFWQSRPMGSLRLFIVKYIVGLMVILLACGLPLAIEWFSIRDRFMMEVGLRMSVLWMAIFSTAFASGCIFRRPAHAAAVAVVGVLLMCFLPVVFPPLQRFNSQVLDLINFQQAWIGNPDSINPLAFVAGFMVLSFAMAITALLAVRFHWHVASEQPLIYGAAGAAFLILLESASYQLGNNLPILSSVDLPDGRQAAGYRNTGISMNGSCGTSLTMHVDSEYGNQWVYESQPFTVSGDRIALGPGSAKPLYMDEESRWYGVFAARNPRDPSVIYQVDLTNSDLNDEYNGVGIANLSILSDGNGSPATQNSTVELWRGKNINMGFLRIWKDRLYVVGQRSIVFDLSDPLHPKRLSDEPAVWPRQRNISADEEPTIDLPPAPGLPASERLKFALDWYGGSRAFDGTIWCRYIEQGVTRHNYKSLDLEAARLETLTDDTAHFKLIAKYAPTLVQRMFIGPYYSRLRLKNGLLYDVQYNFVDIFDLTGPRPLRLIAHFAAPSIAQIEPLDDGRAIAAGDKLYLLGPPPRH